MHRNESQQLYEQLNCSANVREEPGTEVAAYTLL